MFEVAGVLGDDVAEGVAVDVGGVVEEFGSTILDELDGVSEASDDEGVTTVVAVVVTSVVVEVAETPTEVLSACLFTRSKCAIDAICYLVELIAWPFLKSQITVSLPIEVMRRSCCDRSAGGDDMCVDALSCECSREALSRGAEDAVNCVLRARCHSF